LRTRFELAFSPCSSILTTPSAIDCFQADIAANAAISRPVNRTRQESCPPAQKLAHDPSSVSAHCHNRQYFLWGISAFERKKALTLEPKYILPSQWHGTCFLVLPNPTFSTPQKRDSQMIDGAKRKRRNGAKGEPRRLWYARWRAARFAQHFGLGQMATVTVAASAGLRPLLQTS
jgi:hypothetical protein